MATKQAAESRSGIGSGGWTVTYGQDRWGNLYSTSAGISSPTGMPGAASDFNAASNRLATGSYDSEGNLLSRSGSPIMTYDSANRLVSAQPSGLAAITYTYDGEGRRVKQTRSVGSTVFVYDAFGHLAAEYGASSGESCTGCYVSQDMLGSTRLVTERSGTVRQRLDYLPFGTTLDTSPGDGGRSLVFDGTSATTYSTAGGPVRKFTGKERDGETGLDYFGARYMSAAQGRFTSADPYVFQFAAASHTNDQERQKQLQEMYFSNPQSWNKYAYGLNNPLKFIDPNGECSKPSNQKEDETGICIEAFIAQDWFGTPPIGRGDQRTFSGSDASLTARSRIKITVDKNGKITSQEVESARSGIVVNGFGLTGDTKGTATSQPQGNGASSVHVDLWGRNGEYFLAPLAPSGILQGRFNFNVSASGKVDFVKAGSSVTGFPSWGIYAYPASGGVQTVKEIPENKIQDLQKPPRPIQ